MTFPTTLSVSVFLIVIFKRCTARPLLKYFCEIGRRIKAYLKSYLCDRILLLRKQFFRHKDTVILQILDKRIAG